MILQLDRLSSSYCHSIFSGVEMKPGVICLLFALGAVDAQAADKFKVQVVEASGLLSSNRYGTSVTATAKIILPNGDHADLFCKGEDGHCAKIDPIAPEKMKPNATTSGTVGDQYVTTTRDLGEYTASRNGNYITIEAPNGKLRFKIVGSW